MPDSEIIPGDKEFIKQLSKGIHPPEDEVEERGEGHPGQIRHEHPPGGFADLEESPHRQKDGKPHQKDFCQRPAEFVRTKEDRRPCGVHAASMRRPCGVHAAFRASWMK